MTSQISKIRVLVIAFFMMASVNIQAQQSDMQALIGQSLSKLEQPTPEAFLNCIAEMKRIDVMFPDSIQPKYQMALQSLNFSVMNPQAPQTENLLAETEQTIAKLEQMKNSDQSDICTLRGFLYMVRIVQNPAQNGQRYYIEVMQNYEKALKLNPDNQLAKDLQQKFYEGMRQHL
jgi:tetratricopeptide (TPR) repeat protein